ncbi:hypothetical protein [Halobaculum sp. D14]|uniref:hypothetical protein n=1 Tax=unclassified Halobaculum TaxID=2640896 RepID=UPI003EBA0E38
MTDGSPNDESEREARIQRLADRLDATEERPVTREANAYLGEAAAVARDLADHDADPAVVRERAGHVVDLLDELDGTGDDEADSHVDAARALAAELAAEPDATEDRG